MPATLFDKIWSEHAISSSDEGDLVLIDRILLHERTGGIALQSLAAANRRVVAPEQVFATIDHVVDTRPGRTALTGTSTAARFIDATRREARAASIRLFDIDDSRQGIVHVIAPELGIALPGLTVVCPDSHTGTQGALGALAWGIGSSEAEHALATQTLRVARPQTMRITVDGTLVGSATAKDLALHLLAQHGSAGGRGFAVEFAGPAVRGLDLESRMTLCNMATEFSAFAAIVAPDERTIEYVRGRPFAPAGNQWARAEAAWRKLTSDADAVFDAEIRIDAGHVRPMVTWGTNPQHAVPVDSCVPRWSQLVVAERRADYERALAYMGLRGGEPLIGMRVEGAFIGACTNSRLGDLRRAARILAGRHVAAGVRAICVPGSTSVKRAAEAERLDQVFREAGFEWRESGCAMCFHAGGESFGSRERVISSTNRNFEGRQGPGVRTHLASPETVAASAVAGRIADPSALVATSHRS